MAAAETVGMLHGDTPYLKVGNGQPLVMVQGLTPAHEIPTGWEAKLLRNLAGPFARQFTVYAVNRKHGLQPGESMSDIAGHLADAIEHDIGEPVVLHGTSTGGSVALQLAVDRPDLVRRLVVVSAAYRLGQRGRELQADMARLIRAGKQKQAWASVMTAMLPERLRGVAAPFSQLVGSRMSTSDPTDALITLEAEDAFDVEDELPRVTAPTLVVGGSRDIAYSPDLFVGTAAGVQDGRAYIFPGWGHIRASGAAATAHLSLGFMLAGTQKRSPR